MSIKYINEFAPYWLCNECDNISNDQYLCTTCDKTFRCTECLCITNKKLYENDKYIKCEICEYKINTIIGIIPQKWSFIKENENEYLYVDITSSFNEECVKRNFKLKFNFTNIDIKNNINDFLCNFPKVEYIDNTQNILTSEELSYIYLMMILFERLQLSTCNCPRCLLYKITMKHYINVFILNNQAHENITKINLINKYFNIFFSMDILTISMSLINNIDDIDDIDNIINILQSSMYEENPKYSVTEKILNEIKEKSIKFKDCNNDDKDTSCCICMDDYEDDTHIIELECCKKIIHTDCILKWFSEYNHDCPLCKYVYEYNDTPINIANPAEESSEESSEESDNEPNSEIDDIPIHIANPTEESSEESDNEPNSEIDDTPFEETTIQNDEESYDK